MQTIEINMRQVKVEFTTIECRRGEAYVYHYFTNPDNSVLAGMLGKTFVEIYPSVEEAQEAHPEAELGGGGPVSGDPGPIAPSWFDEAYAGESRD